MSGDDVGLVTARSLAAGTLGQSPLWLRLLTSDQSYALGLSFVNTFVTCAWNSNDSPRPSAVRRIPKS